MSKGICIPMSSVMKNVTLKVNVTGVRTNKVRCWLGLKLIKLAAFVMGTGFKVES